MPDATDPTGAEFTFAPLTPSAFLDRSAAVFAERTAVVDGDVRLTYAELSDRSARLVSALARAGVGAGDRVAALCANSHVMLELHNAVPGARRGAGLDQHPAVAVRDGLHRRALRRAGPGGDPRVRGRCPHPRRRCRHRAGPRGRGVRRVAGRAGRPRRPRGRRRARAARHQLHERDDREAQGRDVPPPRRLPAGDARWPTTRGSGRRRATCGRCRCSTATAGASPGRSPRPAAPTCACAPSTPSEIWRLLRAEGITHFSAAPTVLTMIAEDPSAEPLERRVHVDTGGAPPSPALLARLDPLGLDVTHLYGLTETFGPIADQRVAARVGRARRRRAVAAARPAGGGQPDRTTTAGGRRRRERRAGRRRDDRRDRRRGNDVMLGYYRDEEATAAVTRSGGSSPATSGSCTRTATSRSATAART